MSSIFRVRLCYILACVLLAGAPSVADAAKTSGLIVVVLGSSTAWGAGATPITQAWSYRYGAYLQGLDPSNRFINLAVSGYTTYHVLPTGTPPLTGRPSPDPQHNITAALALHPDAVIVNLPSNDTSMGFSAAEQEANYRTIARVAGEANVPIWIATSQPRNMTLIMRNTQKEVRDWIRMIYGQRSVDFWTTVARPDGTIASGYDSGDGIHLNNAGHDVLYRRVIAAGIPELLARTTTTAVNDPYGDLDGDGAVTDADVALMTRYLADPTQLTAAQQDRIRRYGDVANVVNQTTIGNGVVDSNDTMRLLLLSGGQIDAGTAGPVRQDYGDVNGDGHVDIVDALLVSRSMAGLVTDPAILERIHTRGLGDVSPTVPSVTFGDGTIDSKDLTVLTARAAGNDANPPAYVDYWPLHVADPAAPLIKPDLVVATDISGLTGDANHQVRFVTDAVEERRGYTVTRIAGSDGSVLAAFKGIDGSIYALYVDYPQAFGDHRLEFMSPLKLLDASAARGPAAPWAASTTGAFSGIPSQSVIATGTVLDRADHYTPAAGDFTIVAPGSTWSKAVRARLDIALLRGDWGTMDMQQAFFYEFAPFIGVVERAQSPYRGSLAAATDRPDLVVNEITSRGIQYTRTAP
ncbi:MAG TPA: GDSL-type esterase/lipase family protein [Armatimonadota bacterium]